MKGTFTIYTDGACEGNQFKKNEGGWAFIILDSNNKIIKTKSGGEQNTTNNKMELLACIQGLKEIKKIISESNEIPPNKVKNHQYPKPIRILINTDSAYISNAINQKWINKWQQNGWHTSNKKAVKNQLLWKALISYLMHPDFQITFKKVKGHSGDRFNDLADNLAVKAINH